MTTLQTPSILNRKVIKFWKVTARGGHVGAGNTTELVFYIKASNAIRASDTVKRFPAVKHHKNNAILKVVEITEAEYLENLSGYSAYDRYNNKKEGPKSDRK